MSEIKDRQDAASDIDPIVAALANDTMDDTWAAAAVEGTIEAVEPVEADAETLATPEVAADPFQATAGDAANSAAGIETDDATVAVDFTAAAAQDEAPFDDAVQTGLAADGDEAALADAPLVDAVPAIEAMPTELPAGTEFVLVDDLTDGASLSDIAPSAVEATPFERVAAAYADTIVELENPTADAEDDGPLLDGELEDGIASVFAALHAAAMDGATPPIEPLGELEAADGVTFRLLGELDRLWHRAA